MKPIVFETFRKFSPYQQDMATFDEPYCFNGVVAIRKYRITVEEVEEPIEVLRARLQELWDRCDNHHHWQPLRAEAKNLGMKLEFKK